jgi:predicted heme/steroid binding protein
MHDPDGGARGDGGAPCRLEYRDIAEAFAHEKESLLIGQGIAVFGTEFRGSRRKNINSRSWEDGSENGIFPGSSDQDISDADDSRNKAIASIFVLIIVLIWLIEIEVTRNLFGGSDESENINSYFLIWMARNLYVIVGFGTARLLCMFAQDDQIFSFFVWQPTRKNLVRLFSCAIPNIFLTAILPVYFLAVLNTSTDPEHD